MKLEGKVVLVTGAARGIGRATALEFAKRGCLLACNFLREREAAESLVQEISSLGSKAIAVQGDIARENEIDAMGRLVEKEFGQVDVLVNNAGEIIRPAGWLDIRGEDLDRTFAVNAMGALRCAQRFAPSMAARGYGRIVNLTTTYAQTGVAPIMAYAAAKASIAAITSGLARELGKQGVLVNAVAPGNIDTDMTRRAGDDAAQWAISTTPVGRLGHANEVAEAIVWLATSDFITGHVLVVDGGQLLNM